MKRSLFLFLIFLFWPVFILAAERVDINTAPLGQLDEIVGIGPTLAQRIIDARPYSSIDDLLKVKGIGEKTLQNIKDQGLATVAQASPGKFETQNPETGVPAKPATLASGKSEIISNPETPKTYPVGVIVNEILPSPDGADETNEFIELYNGSGGDINLTGWKLQDTQGTQATYTFPNTTMAAGGYLTLARPVTKILLNDTDQIALLFPNGQTADTTSYTSAPAKQSYNKTGSGWSWSTTPTPSNPNKITVVAAKPKTLLKARKTDNKTTAASTSTDYLANLATAGLSGPLKGGGQNPWLLFAVAGVIAIVSGIAFLVLKLKK
ncbi:MAG: hypothetical protein A3C50_00455 [Candidatus Staskawiczbacteria bacterium RIFCSPHIGHO2_02_FULL_43_16]|uniref:LTD domain-containing protein n=1 Tax=Candidatus Staskawiczbacteria bacterium RIFCSPHIGHO2_01_FULL_41_41 TaxID=1802203 RepID=A0A1G2HWB9_9BACT|nr:MAG: hypothetical protein A2822_02120 [Candidatus Staskawiczbacteria bacterium RIFCSPHIGHO2_01_FULL_41_41]OGZ68955.1 MAG: hypothetical protein A3C50_00455 [Candidatus Staskawiczbacteria bacterium RIFCSPHIGHO2_02_FULL_43_16]OGZ74863.1 MAG: hypothetical protein A3A12_03360 [Candidatus Staskawiczbacteria bacterium RIFCSPLOWO2_01_FULL_43_17b]